MIKLIFNRFTNEAEQTIKIGVETSLTTTGFEKGISDIKSIKNTIDDVNNKPLNINVSSIASASKQLGNLQKLLTEFKKNNSNININAGINALKNFGVFNTLPTNTQKVLGELANTQSATLNENSLANTQTGISAIKQLLDDITVSLKESDNAADKTANSMKNVKNETNDAKGNTKDFKNELKSIPSLVDQISKGFRSLDIVKLVYLYHGVKRVSTAFVDAVNNAAGYEESLNLYSMAFGKYTERATEWAKEISDALMLDPSPLMQYAGAFYNLTKGMGVTSEHAYIMSKNLTQLTYDMASYLNISNEAAQAKIQSAMAGQSRAVASVGVATQMASLQELAHAMNIKKSVSEMTQAEKTYLRYIQLMRSTTQMQGDLGKTMITPANTIRILKNQINLLSRAIGQVLTPIVMEAIPYLMALTNVLTKAAQSLAHALGYELSDVDFTSKFGMEDIDNYAKSLENAGDSAKKAGKRVNESLAPFDELNNVISENSGVGKKSGKDTGLIDSSVWDKALPQYDMLSKYVSKMKDKAKGLEDSVGKIIGLVSGFLALGAAVKIINGLAKVVKAAGTLWSALKNINLVMSNILTISGKLLASSSPLLQALGVLGTGTEVIGGALLLNDSYNKWSNASFEALESGKDTPQASEYLKVAAGSAEAALGGGLTGAAIGALFGGIGAPIGAAIGAGIGEISYMLSSMNEANTALEKYNKLCTDGYYAIKNNTNALAAWNTQQANGMSSMHEHIGAELARVGTYEKMRDRLHEIVDANGKVKEGYEGEAAVIVDKLNAGLGMNIKLQDGQIKNYDKISTEIDKVIKKKKAEVVINHMSEAYADALLNQKEAVKQLDKATKNLEEAKKKGFDTSPIEEERKEYERLKTEYDNAVDHYDEVMRNKEAFDAAYLEFTKGHYEKVVEIFQNAGDKQYEYTALALRQMTNELNGGPLSEDMITAWKKLASDSSEDFNRELEKVADPVARSKIIAAVRKLDNPLRLAADDGGKLYASESVYTIQEYFSDPKHSLKPQLVLPNQTPPELLSGLQTYFSQHNIGLNITANTSPQEILQSFIKYFSKNPLKVAMEIATGKNNSLINGVLGALKITKFANGGFPTSGDLFFANENGRAEYITSVGNQTAVANQGQMVQVLTNAITAGFNKIQGGNASNVVVYVGDKKLYEGQGEYQNRQNDRYGTTVVRI